MLRACAIALVSALLFAPAALAGDKIIEREILIPDVELRPGVTVDLSVNIYEHCKGLCQNPVLANMRTIFAIHGYGHTANTWKPFAEAILKNNPIGFDVCRVAALDLPGRGGSSLPRGLIYGELTLEDHVVAIQGALDGLAAHEGIRPHHFVGHSQGGLLAQMLQDKLWAADSSLAKEYGITNVVLLGPAPPAEIPWGGNPQVEALFHAFLYNDPERGYIWWPPDPVWAILPWFKNLNEELVPNAPNPETVTQNGYSGPEPEVASLQLMGLPPEPNAPPTPRPSVGPGIFGAGAFTRFSIVGFEHDVFVSPEDNEDTFQHLTNGTGFFNNLVIIQGLDTCHDMYLTDPAGMLKRLRGSGVRF